MIGLAAIMICGLILNSAMVAESKRLNTYCDNHYGVDGWVMNETTGTGECKNYMGQCWHCINKSDTK